MQWVLQLMKPHSIATAVAALVDSTPQLHPVLLSYLYSAEVTQWTRVIANRTQCHRRGQAAHFKSMVRL
jgi:hypothetical protein